MDTETGEACKCKKIRCQSYISKSQKKDIQFQGGRASVKIIYVYVF